MEKNTILAIVLSSLVIMGFYIVQLTFFPPAPAQSAPAAVGVTAAPSSGETEGGAAGVRDPAPVGEKAPEAAALPVAAGPEAVPESTTESFAPLAEERVVVETDLVRVELTNAGGDLVSFQLKEHKDSSGGEPRNVDMVFAGSAEAHAFSVAFGGRETAPVTSLFFVKRVSDTVVEFYREFTLDASLGGGAFRLTKRYTFLPGEYLFELVVSIDSARPGEAVPANLNFGGAAYTLSFGPQIGPQFEKLDNYADYRRYMSYANKKLKNENVPANRAVEISSRFIWAAIAGKYFTLIAIPDSTLYTLAFSQKPDSPGVPTASRLYLTRPPLTGARAQDTYRFYLGPKDSDILARYDNGTNFFGYTDMGIEKVGNTSGFWSILNPLERLLKWLLTLFHKVIPNWGVAIILVTLIVKVALFPLTRKGSESTLRMQQMSPKIKELQEKYKDNPQKMNLAMAELYKKEGYNPLSGCLPLLLQLPIFFAMYNLFNNHFDLRGALFIPGWIPDLSLPDSIWNFAPVRLPILGWSDLRLLPFIYVGSQLLYSKVTQTPDQQANKQMMMMMYLMPVIFFFVLYNGPSGLLVYWITSNILTMVQQLVINKYIAQRKAALGLTNQPPPRQTVTPPKKRKRK